MAISRDDILTAGMRVFREKGYDAASVQDIANECGISKASLYSFFPSKEDIFMDVFTGIQDSFRDNMTLLYSTKLDPRTRFVRASTLLMQIFSTNYLTMLASNDPSTPAIRKRKDDFAAWLFLTFKDLLSDLYGPEIEPYIWDVTVIWRAINREFMNLLAQGNMEGHSVDEAAEHLCTLIDKYAERLLNKDIDSFMSPAIAQAYIGTSIDEFTMEPQTLDRFFENVENSLVNLRSEQRADEIRTMVRFFKEEIESESPRWFLLHAIMDSLRKESELWSITKQLQQLLIMIHPGFEEW